MRFSSRLSVLAALLLLLTLSGAAQIVATSDIKPQAATQPLPDDPIELDRARLQSEQDLNLANAVKRNWDQIAQTIQISQSNLKSVKAPPPSAVDTLDLARKSGAVKQSLDATLRGLQSIYSISYPSNIPQMDQATSLFIMDWRNKSDNIAQDTGIISFIEAQQPSTSQAISISDDDMKLIRQAVANFDSTKSKAADLLQAELTEANKQSDAATKQIQDLQSRQAEIAKRLKNSRAEITQIAVRWGLPSFCLSAVFMLVVPILVTLYSNSPSAAQQFELLYSSGMLTEVITVLLLAMTILILGLANKIEGPVLGTLLGGISGYVLNRLKDKNGDKSSTSAPVPPQPPPAAASPGAGIK